LSRCCAFESENRPELCDVLASLVDIAIRSVIFGSRHAASLWKEICHNTYRSHIQLHDFAAHLFDSGREEFIDFLRSAAPSEWKMMDINHFWCLCCWFPNFYNRENSADMMTAIVDSHWYARDEKDAKARLNKVTKGKAFVICPSEVNPFTFPYNVITIDDGVKKETIIKRSRIGPKVLLTCALLPGREFDTLPRLAVAIAKEVGYLMAPKL